MSTTQLNYLRGGNIVFAPPSNFDPFRHVGPVMVLDMVADGHLTVSEALQVLDTES